MINVFSKTVVERYWYVYNGEVEIDGPFPTKEAAYAAARAHERRFSVTEASEKTKHG
jgi:hypothetical protein